MATNAEALDYIKSRYTTQLVNEEPGFLNFRFKFNDGRTQMLFVGGEPSDDFLVLATPFAQIAEHKAEAVLDKTESLIFGVRKLSGWYVLAHALPVESLDHSEIEWSMNELASAGDRAEAMLSSTDRY
jgi:hypothetical protein